jgi:hypothetical protein
MMIIDAKDRGQHQRCWRITQALFFAPTRQGLKVGSSLTWWLEFPA